MSCISSSTSASRDQCSRRRILVTTCFFLATVAATVTGCAPGREDRVLVLAAASAIDALEAAIEDFESRSGIAAETSFGPTSTLARQLTAGAPGALFLAASREWADFVGSEVAVERSVTLAGNRLVVIAPATSGRRTPARDTGTPQEAGMTAPGALPPEAAALAALRDPERRRWAIADPEAVPAGIYARQALEAVGLWEQLEGRLIVTVDVRAALVLVAAGEADGGIVYATDVYGNDAVRMLGAFGAHRHAPIEYPLLLLASGGPGARALFDFLVSDEGRAHFLARGFTAPAR